MQGIEQKLFAQSTELINAATNRGLPPILVVDEPGKSFILKGIDPFSAVLQSELGFLANPAGDHIQSAEMSNQTFNSLALISARYTHVSVEIFRQLAAAQLMAACRAMDLRATHLAFLNGL